MPRKPEILKVSSIARSRLFEVEALSLRFANGTECEFERLRSRGRGAVMILAIDEHDQILLIREYAAGLERYLLTLPKGLIDPGEDVLTAANRELQEEAGFAANTLTEIRQLAAVPNYMSFTIDLVLAESLYPSRLKGDEPEPLELVRWPLARIDELAMHPEFCEGRAVAALYLARAALEKRRAKS